MRGTSIGVLLLASTLAAQTTWTVGTGGSFTSINEAMTSARVSPGDTLKLIPEVHNGHTGFRLTKGVNLVGPMVISDYRSTGRCYTEVSVPPGQRARLVDLRFTLGCYGPSGSSSHVEVKSGRVQFDGCEFTGSQRVLGGFATFVDCKFGGIGLVANARTHLLRSTLTAAPGNPALTVNTPAVVAAVASTFYGGRESCLGRNGCQGPIPSLPGIRVRGGSFHGSRLTVVGGANLGWGHLPTAPGVLVEFGRVWLSDSNVVGGRHFLLAGGAGIENRGSAPVRVARTPVSGGAGTPNGPVTAGSGTVDLSAPLVGVDSLQPGLQTGMPYTLRYFGRSGQPLAVLASASLGAPPTSPLTEQPVWMFDTPNWAVVVTRTFGATGVLDIGLRVPANPRLVGQSIWFHGFSGLQSPLQATPPIGGIVR